MTRLIMLTLIMLITHVLTCCTFSHVVGFVLNTNYAIALIDRVKSEFTNVKLRLRAIPWLITRIVYHKFQSSTRRNIDGFYQVSIRCRYYYSIEVSLPDGTIRLIQFIRYRLYPKSIDDPKRLAIVRHACDRKQNWKENDDVKSQHSGN